MMIKDQIYYEALHSKNLWFPEFWKDEEPSLDLNFSTISEETNIIHLSQHPNMHNVQPTEYSTYSLI